MLKRDGELTFGTHIYFRNLGRRNPVTGIEEPKRKTNLYGVWNNDEPDNSLGSILWNPGWRKYVFRPLVGTIYEETCMREIAQFIEEETKAHKAATAKRKKTAKRRYARLVEMYCYRCEKSTKHGREPEHETTHYVSTVGRGPASDYRFMRCTKCGYGQEWDFARD